MKLIRKSVFETNSSSCHSLTLGSGDTFEGFTPNVDGMIVLPPQEFGWEEETYNDVESRLAYVFIYIRDWCGDSNNLQLEMYEKVVFEHTGANSISMPSTKTEWGYDGGYIDHQSVESRDLDYLFADKTTLKQFLFGSGSSIETDNDNH